ncbi:MAG: DNA-3-methyladenine glycosylase [Verrucomicrobiota bacterium]|jgi:DNA-3-methyladenine glycosylase II
MHEAAVEHLCAADRRLARLVRRVGPCGLRVDRRASPYQALVEAVAHQQLHGAAARAILARVVALYPGRPFPTPQDLVDTPAARLRAAGFSGAKVAAVKDIAARTLAGGVPDRAGLRRWSDEEIIGRLTELRGVGRWTVEMLLIFKLGRRDVLPVDDFGVRKGFAVVYRAGQMPRPRELREHGERWRPYRSVAAWYLWRAADLA